jgi:hypothetical protein
MDYTKVFIPYSYNSLLIKHCPKLYGLYNPTTKQKDKIEAVFKKRAVKMLSQTVTEEYWASFIELLLFAEEQRIEGTEFVKFVENSINEIIQSNKSTASFIRKNIHDMLTAIDDGARYRDYLSEIVVLATLLKNENIKLVQVEKKLINGKKADFCILVNGVENIIDVFSIDCEINRIKTDEDLITFIYHRAIEKLKKKQVDINNENLQLIPIIWGNIEEIVKFETAIKVLYDNNCFSNAFGPLVIIKEYENINTWHYTILPINMLRKN